MRKSEFRKCALSALKPRRLSAFPCGSPKYKSQALEYLQELSPVALWVPGMQTDGFRVDGEVTYLTQLTDLSGNGHNAVQGTDTAQAYLSGADAVFSGGQSYDATFDYSTPSLTAISRYSSAGGGRIFCTITGPPFISIGVGSSRDVFDVNGWIDTGLYIDDGTTNNIIYEFVNTGNYSDIGIGRSNTSSDRLVGTISTIAIYNKALTDHEQAVVNQCLNILGA